MGKARRYREVEGEKMEGPVAVSGKTRRFLPRVNFNFEDLPEAKDWEVGETYHLALEVKQIAKHESEGHNGAEFEITGVKVLSNEK